MNCVWDENYRNNWDGDHNVIRDDYYFAGMESVHDNKKEDRRYKWKYCKPGSSEPLMGPFTGSRSRTLPETLLDEEWTRSCKDLNGGHAAIHGIESTHNNHFEDRKWTIKCGLLDRNKYRLTNCKGTYYGNMGGWDDDIKYGCSNSGVLRTIQSRHWDATQDRQFKVECCTLDRVWPTEYSFSDVAGYWDHKGTCLGNCVQTYTQEYGVSREFGSERSTAWEAALSVSISAGFEAGLPGGSVNSQITVEASLARSVSNTMSSSIARDYAEGFERECDGDHLYQWVMEAEEIGPDGQGTVDIPSNHYLCTDNADDPNGKDENDDPVCLPNNCQVFESSPTPRPTPKPTTACIFGFCF